MIYVKKLKRTASHSIPSISFWGVLARRHVAVHPRVGWEIIRVGCCSVLQSTLEAVYSRYIESMLMIHWKDHMTRYFQRIWATWLGIGNMQDVRSTKILVRFWYFDDQYDQHFCISLPLCRSLTATLLRWRMIVVLTIQTRGFKRPVWKHEVSWTHSRHLAAQSRFEPREFLANA